MSTTPVAHFFNYERSVTPMGRRTRECLLCGIKYEYCPTCSQDKMKPTWMAEFHDENCKNIFDIATRFNMQLLTKEEAKAAMEKCDLSNKENFKDYLAKYRISIAKKILEKNPSTKTKIEKSKKY